MWPHNVVELVVQRVCVGRCDKIQMDGVFRLHRLPAAPILKTEPRLTSLSLLCATSCTCWLRLFSLFSLICIPFGLQDAGALSLLSCNLFKILKLAVARHEVKLEMRQRWGQEVWGPITQVRMMMHATTLISRRKIRVRPNPFGKDFPLKVPSR